VTDDYVEVGTNVKYGFVHQYGMTITAKPGQPGQNSIGPRKGAKAMKFTTPFGVVYAKKVVIPARPFLPLKAGGELSLPQAWETMLVKALKKHFTPGE
jgi:phage gpG-like protein